MLRAEGLKSTLWGELRSKVSNNRVKSLLLVIMINKLLKERIWDEFGQNYDNSATEEEKGKLYLSLCLKYLNAVSLEEDVHERHKLRDTPSLSRKATSSEIISVTEKYIWTDDLAEQICARFPSSLSPAEQKSILLLKAQVLPFQQFLHLSSSLLITWPPTVLLSVIEGNRRLGEEDIFDVDLKSLFVHYSNTKKLTKTESLDLQITPQYDTMMEILGSPLDVFRTLNPNIVGTTTQCHHFAKEKPTRTDFVFQYKRLKPKEGKEEKKGEIENISYNNLLGISKKEAGQVFTFKLLKSDTWALHSFNFSEDLSDHQAVSVIFYPFDQD